MNSNPITRKVERMKDIGDFLAVTLITIIIWGTTAMIVLVLSINLGDIETTGPIAMAIASMAAIGFVALWLKGRSISKAEQKSKLSNEPSDADVVIAYGALFEDLDTSRYIYDESVLPYSKERILSAALRVLDREDSSAMLRAAAALTTELSQFQKGVGATPRLTLMSVMLDAPTGDIGKIDIDQHARRIANHSQSKSDIERLADAEREKLLSLVGDAVHPGGHHLRF